MRLRRHKYGAQPTTVDNIRFASKAEARRYCDLKMLEKAGEISELELQPRYELLAWPARGDRTRAMVGHYVADFRYRQWPQGILVVEDVKSKPTMTAIYRWKKRHMLAQYGIQITEVS